MQGKDGRLLANTSYNLACVRRRS